MGKFTGLHLNTIPFGSRRVKPSQDKPYWFVLTNARTGDGLVLGSGLHCWGVVLMTTHRKAMKKKKDKSATVVQQPGRKERIALILERDGNHCVWCQTEFHPRFTPPTREHLVPRIKGGPSWLENEMAACRRCNAARGHQTIGAWFVECQSMGREPNGTAIIARLEDLTQCIEKRGGQRKARRYLESQLRRLRRAVE